jgi:hypothetical protein
MVSQDNGSGMKHVVSSEKHQTEYVDTIVPPGEEEAIEHMSWHTYAGLFVSAENIAIAEDHALTS